MTFSCSWYSLQLKWRGHNGFYKGTQLLNQARCHKIFWGQNQILKTWWLSLMLRFKDSRFYIEWFQIIGAAQLNRIFITWGQDDKVSLLFNSQERKLQRSVFSYRALGVNEFSVDLKFCLGRFWGINFIPYLNHDPSLVTLEKMAGFSYRSYK